MEQQAPTVSEGDVQRVVKRDFPLDEYEMVISELMKYEHRETHRVQLAALKISDGNIVELKKQIDCANADYRDVLSFAEYPAYRKMWSQISKLSGEEKDKIILSDWNQYKTWLNKK